MKILLLIIAFALASANAQSIDVSFSSSNRVNIDTSELQLDYDDTLYINGEIWNGKKTWIDQEGTFFNETWLNEKLHQKKIVWINGTQVITIGD